MENVSVPVLTVSRLSKNYGRKTALRDFSYTFTPGIYGLLGPNGAGKSTLMGILSSALHPTSGTVQYGGRDIFALGPAYRAVLGVVPQQMPLYDFFTGQEYLEYIAALHAQTLGLGITAVLGRTYAFLVCHCVVPP